MSETESVKGEGQGECQRGGEPSGQRSMGLVRHVRVNKRACAHTQAWLEGIDERIQKMRVQGDRDNESTAFVLRDLRKKIKATGVRTTF